TKIYAGWREKRLLQHASALLQKQDLTGATTAAQKVLQLHPDSLPAFYILADATEKQNLLETVAWRAQIARLRPRDLDSQFNLAVLEIKSAEPVKRERARVTLEKLSKVSQYRAGSLRALLNDAVERKDLAVADTLAQELQMSPQVTFGDLILCLNFYRKLDE